MAVLQILGRITGMPLKNISDRPVSLLSLPKPGFINSDIAQIWIPMLLKSEFRIPALGYVVGIFTCQKIKEQATVPQPLSSIVSFPACCHPIP